MKNLLLLSLFFSGIFCNAFCQGVKLTAIFDFNNSAIKLNWNMVKSNSRSSYLLLRSNDGVTWTEAAKDRMLRNYSDDDIYFFNDRNYSPGKNFYRLRIADGSNTTIALSPVVTVNANGAFRSALPPVIIKQKEAINNNQSNSPSQINSQIKSSNTWIIYPNPATDFLNLAYKGTTELKGVVNVQIQNVIGKTVIKFRSGSIYKIIQIPISSLPKGAYFIQVTVMNELMMSQKFIKQ